MHLHCAPPKLINPFSGNSGPALWILSGTFSPFYFKYMMQWKAFNLSYFTLKWGGFKAAQHSAMLKQLQTSFLKGKFITIRSLHFHRLISIFSKEFLMLFWMLPSVLSKSKLLEKQTTFIPKYYLRIPTKHHRSSRVKTLKSLSSS